jgi:hypothetical protein
MVVMETGSTNKNTTVDVYLKNFILAVFIVAVAIRFLLFLSNPPENSFDNHFNPIYLIMQTGKIPPKNACWQCYQPPVFYGLSAMIGKFALGVGIDKLYLPKILQFLCFLYGALHLGVVYLILKKITLSSFSKVIAFATACFLPGHIYITAMHSNDTISYLAVAICIYLLIIVIERKLALSWSILLSIAMAVAIFTKYTAFALIPTVIFAYMIILFRRVIVPARKVMISMAVTFLLPLLFLGSYLFYNMKTYDTALPWNSAILNPVATQPHASDLSFVTFKPGEFMAEPILRPGNLDSFWTLLYSRMWFDVEPKFLYFTDPDDQWWHHYYSWIRGEEPFPAEAKRFSAFTRFFGFWLLALGLFPLLISIAGGWRILFGKWRLWGKSNGIEMVKMQIFPAFLMVNLAGMIAYAIKNPVFSCIKAIYLLNSLPALAVLLGVGVMLFEKYKIIKGIIGVVFVTLFILVIFHILYIVGSAWQI